MTRLKQRLSDPEWRRYGYLLLGGKLLGVAFLLAIVTLLSDMFGHRVQAADAALAGNDIVNPINTVWTLVAAFLVFGMQAGFTFLEVGFCRSREAVNVLMECVVDTCMRYPLLRLGLRLHVRLRTPFFGTEFFLQAPGDVRIPGVASLASGSSVRVRRYLLDDHVGRGSAAPATSAIGQHRRVGLHLSDHRPLGLRSGWLPGADGRRKLLASSRVSDFAGSTVVHTIGVIALTVDISGALGAVQGDGGGPMLPHDLSVATVGGFILWFGWYGFNPGSTLSAMDFEGIGRIAANTTLAACAAGLAAMFTAFPKTKTWDVSFTVNGFLAGLVAVTCPCYWVSPTGAILLGAIAGVIVVYAVDLLEYLRIDDPIGAVPVHGVCGIWGTISLGLFACGQYGVTGPLAPDNSAPLTGLLYGGGTTVLMAQLIGSAIVTTATFAVSMTMMYAINAMGVLRVSPEGEMEGLDLHEHGIPCYPEYAMHASAQPQGAPAFTRDAYDAYGVRAVIVNGVPIREEGRDVVDANGPLPGHLLRGGRAR
jgi:Amt family ammonium transporter